MYRLTLPVGPWIGARLSRSRGCRSVLHQAAHIDRAEWRIYIEDAFKGGVAMALQFGAGGWMFGQFIDRYATDAYGPPVGTLEIIERAGRVGDLVALDLNYPFDGPDITLDQVREALQRANLRAIAITPVIV